MNAWEYDTDDPDLKQLFDLARDKTAAGRTILAKVVSDLFFSRETTVTDRERALMTDILRHLILEAEIELRRKLAERLSTISDAPRELLVTLANDEIEVAHPILINSTLLCDEELIEIIRHRTIEHQLAIAARKTVSESVSDALIEVGQEDVVERLLENERANISQAAMAYLVEESRRVDRYQNPLVRRRELSPALARRMYWWISAALRTHIIERFDIDPADLDEAMEQSTRNLVDGEAQPDQTGPEAAKTLAEMMNGATPLPPSYMLQALRQGEISFIAAMLAKRTGLRMMLLRRLLYEPGGECLAILCRWAEFSPAEFTELLRLTRDVRPVLNGPAATDEERLANIYLTIKPEAADKIVKTWCRDPEYLRAIHALKHATMRHGRA
jgi:uncharacterized protein (DUF2336 family)